MSTPQSPFAALQALQEEQREGYAPETTPTAMNTAENQNDPYAHLKQALEDGRRIRVRRDHTDPWSKWCKKGDVTFHWNVPVDHYEIEPLPANKWAAEKAAHAQGKRIERREGNQDWQRCLDPQWFYQCEYRIAPDPAPAGKLTDEQLAEKARAEVLSLKGAICSIAAWSTLPGSILNIFARAVREAVEKEQAEEIARLTAIIEQAIEMVNTPGTTKGNLPQAINAKIMQRDEFHDATLKKLDAAKTEIERLKCAYSSLLQAYKKLEATEQKTRDAYDRAMTDCVTLRAEHNALTAEFAKANAELERLRWRSPEIRPQPGDADKYSMVNVDLGEGAISNFNINKWPWESYNIKAWRPFCPPPAPTAEEVERERFEAAYLENYPAGMPDLQLSEDGEYRTPSVRCGFKMWQAARAAKEGEK